jgi:hypothetical protein
MGGQAIMSYAFGNQSSFVTGQVVRHKETGKIYSIISIVRHAPRAYNVQHDFGSFNQNGHWFVNTTGPISVYGETELEAAG